VQALLFSTHPQTDGDDNEEVEKQNETVDREPNVHVDATYE
jgi:hypothetical protein